MKAQRCTRICEEMPTPATCVFFFCLLSSQHGPVEKLWGYSSMPQLKQWCSVVENCRPVQLVCTVVVKHRFASPLPNISTLAIVISGKFILGTPFWRFGVFSWGIYGFCGNSTEILKFLEFPGPSRFRSLGSPFSAFWGEMKLICWAVLRFASFLRQICLEKVTCLEETSAFEFAGGLGWPVS